MTPADATFDGPADLDGDERATLEALVRSMADDEFVLAERYTEWQVRAPTLESDLALSNIAQDELGHARLWYDLLEGFGATEADLIWEAEPGDFRHAAFVERPFEEGDWADAILRGYLFDTYEHLQLEALAESSYRPIADRVGKVIDEEEYHREHAQNWLERLCDDADGRERVQDALDRLFPWALTLFAPTEHADAIVEYGFRPIEPATLRADWLGTVVPFLESLGLRVPVDDDGTVLVETPEPTGRDGAHTEAWPALFEELTHTYRDAGYERPPGLMEDPEDGERA